MQFGLACQVILVKYFSLLIFNFSLKYDLIRLYKKEDCDKNSKWQRPTFPQA
jgi:hypothetical protein